MIQIDDIKSRKEWQALNTIWKTFTPEQKMSCEKEFKIVVEYIRTSCSIKAYSKKVINKDSYDYLSSLSVEAKSLILELVEQGEKNIYHSVMAIIENHRSLTKDELVEFYFRKYQNKRTYLDNSKELIIEIFDLCYDRAREKGWVN